MCIREGRRFLNPVASGRYSGALGRLCLVTLPIMPGSGRPIIRMGRGPDERDSRAVSDVLGCRRGLELVDHHGARYAADSGGYASLRRSPR